MQRIPNQLQDPQLLLVSNKILTIQKKRYRVVLDLEVYDDLDLQQIDWETKLDLQGDEIVEVSIKDYDDILFQIY